MIKKIFLTFLFLLILLPFTNAAQTFTPTVDWGYQIRTLETDYHQVGVTEKYQFHLFNSSNGLPITALSEGGVRCNFHLYNDRGSHIYIANISENDHKYDFEVVVDGGNFTEAGSYDYILSCNSSKQGGFLASHIQITDSGFEDKGTAWEVILIAFVILISVFLYIGFIIPVDEKFFVIKLFFVWFGFTLIIPFLGSLYFITKTQMGLIANMMLGLTISYLFIYLLIVFGIFIFFFKDLIYFFKAAIGGIKGNDDDEGREFT